MFDRFINKSRVENLVTEQLSNVMSRKKKQLGKIRRYQQLPMISDSVADSFKKTIINNSLRVDEKKFDWLVQDIQDVHIKYPEGQSFKELQAIIANTKEEKKKKQLIRQLVIDKINQCELKQRILATNSNPFEDVVVRSQQQDYTDEVPLSRLQVLSEFINQKHGLYEKLNKNQEFIYNHTRVLNHSQTVKKYFKGQIKLNEIESQYSPRWKRKKQSTQKINVQKVIQESLIPSTQSHQAIHGFLQKDSSVKTPQPTNKQLVQQFDSKRQGTQTDYASENEFSSIMQKKTQKFQLKNRFRLSKGIKSQKQHFNSLYSCCLTIEDKDRPETPKEFKNYHNDGLTSRCSSNSSHRRSTQIKLKSLADDVLDYSVQQKIQDGITQWDTQGKQSTQRSQTICPNYVGPNMVEAIFQCDPITGNTVFITQEEFNLLDNIFNLYFRYHMPSDPVLYKRQPIREEGYQNVFMSMVGINSPLTRLNHLFRADRVDIFGKYAAKVVRNAANDPFMAYRKLKHYGVELKQKPINQTKIDQLAGSQEIISREEKIKIIQKKLQGVNSMTLCKPKQQLEQVSQAILNLQAILSEKDQELQGHQASERTNQSQTNMNNDGAIGTFPIDSKELQMLQKQIQELKSIDRLNPDFERILESKLREHTKSCINSSCMTCNHFQTPVPERKLVLQKLYKIWLESELKIRNNNQINKF